MTEAAQLAKDLKIHRQMLKEHRGKIRSLEQEIEDGAPPMAYEWGSKRVVFQEHPLGQDEVLIHLGAQSPLPKEVRTYMCEIGVLTNTSTPAVINWKLNLARTTRKCAIRGALEKIEKAWISCPTTLKRCQVTLKGPDVAGALYQYGKYLTRQTSDGEVTYDLPPWMVETFFEEVLKYFYSKEG